MTVRERRRQRLLSIIRHWMVSRGYLVLAIVGAAVFSLTGVSTAAKVQSTEVVALDSKLTEPKTVSKTATKAQSTAKKKEDKKVVEKSGMGTLVFIRSNKMAVQFTSGENSGEEMFLPFSKDIQFKKVKSFSELGYGDEVKVKYRETITPPAKEGDQPITGNRMAVEVTLIKSVQAKPQPDPLPSKELRSE